MIISPLLSTVSPETVSSIEAENATSENTVMGISNPHSGKKIMKQGRGYTLNGMRSKTYIIQGNLIQGIPST